MLSIPAGVAYVPSGLFVLQPAVSLAASEVSQIPSVLQGERERMRDRGMGEGEEGRVTERERKKREGSQENKRMEIKEEERGQVWCVGRRE